MMMVRFVRLSRRRPLQGLRSHVSTRDESYWVVTPTRTKLIDFGRHVAWIEISLIHLLAISCDIQRCGDVLLLRTRASNIEG